MKYYRVSVSLFGYAIVKGENEEEAFENIKKLTKGDLDIEPRFPWPASRYHI